MDKKVCITAIEWDTDDGYDGEDQELELPSELEIPVSELLYDDETPENTDMEEIKDRIADYLSDQYGFCVCGFCVEENCVLNECVQRGADTDWIVAWASRGPVLVQFENLNEGHCGDYNPDDPEDENLLRFTVYHNGEQVNDASYCTNIRADADLEALRKAAEIILQEVYTPVMAGYRVKRLCEALSWIEIEGKSK